MVEVVPARVVGWVVEAEVGPEVDHRLAAVEELVDPARDGPVGQGEEHGLGIGRDRVVDEQVARGEVRVDATDRVALPLAAHEPDDADVRMEREQPDQLRPDVPRGADDRDSHGVTEARAGAGGGRRAGDGIVRTVRRDRRLDRRVRAHGRDEPLAGGRLTGSAVGRNVVTE